MTIYIYSWANNPKRAAMKGRRCRIVKRLKLNSALIQFLDNAQCEVVSRNALKVWRGAGMSAKRGHTMPKTGEWKCVF